MRLAQAVVFTVVVVLAAAVASASSAITSFNNYSLVLLKDYDDAKCLDGSPGAFYFRPSPVPDTRKFIIFFQGGGWCYTPEDCLKRSKTRLGSSKSYEPTLGADGLSGGVLSPNCTENPDFCDFNVMHFMYCDGSSYSGARQSTLTVGNTSLWFRGAMIRKAMLDYSAKHLNLTAATDVLLSGGSAGGLATFLHMDSIGDYLRSAAPGLTRYGALPLSGFFLAHANTEYQPGYVEHIRGIFDMSEAELGGGLDSRCLARYGGNESWRCMFAEFNFAISTTPTMVLNSKVDAWQIPCILTVTDPGVCFGTRGYEECRKDRNAFPNKCLDEITQRPVLSYAQDFDNRRSEVAGFWAPQSGFFIDSCFLHVEAQDTALWLNIEVGGMSMMTATSVWWALLANNSTVTSGITAGTTPPRISDCNWHAEAPFECNPTCPARRRSP